MLTGCVIQVYIGEMEYDVHTCHRRNVHNRTLADVQKIIKGWQETPSHMTRVDLNSLSQGEAIEEV